MWFCDATHSWQRGAVLAVRTNVGAASGAPGGTEYVVEPSDSPATPASVIVPKGARVEDFVSSKSCYAMLKAIGRSLNAPNVDLLDFAV